jgi:prophage regulatory protein
MKLLSYDDLATKGICFSRSHIWRLIKAGTFPKQVKIGSHTNAWVEAEIDAYIEKRVAERDNATAAA